MTTATLCETPMCECAAKDYCPKERRQAADEIQSDLRDMAEALAKCQEHRSTCRKCETMLLCPDMLTLKREAREIALGHINAAGVKE
jgi:hypothetical protein